MVSSDPHAWLRPIYRLLAREGSFPQLAPIVQFQRLVDAAAAVSEAKAALLRQSSPRPRRTELLRGADVKRTGTGDCRSSFSRILGAPHRGYSRVNRTIVRFQLRRQSIGLSMIPNRTKADEQPGG